MSPSLPSAHANAINPIATLELVNASGSVLGALAPIEVQTPWWNVVDPVVNAVQTRDGLRLTILRLSRLATMFSRPNLNSTPFGLSLSKPHTGLAEGLRPCHRPFDTGPSFDKLRTVGQYKLSPLLRANG